MAHNPHAHLQKEIDSLRKQLIKGRIDRQYRDALRMAVLTVQTEERTNEISEQTSCGSNYQDADR